MGNSSSKDSKGSGSNKRDKDASTASSSRNDTQQPVAEASPSRPTYSSRARRHSRPDLSFLGIGGNSEQDPTTLEARRETKQEREARKLEKERVTRLKERERSMKEEHVDGGYVVTQGVYTGIEDFNKPLVRQLMVCQFIVSEKPS